MKFHFVAGGGSAVDRRSRSYVMKGKNAGRKLARRGQSGQKQKVAGLEESLSKPRNEPEKSVPPGTALIPASKRSDDEILFPELQLAIEKIPHNIFAGEEYSYFTFPIPFTPSMRYLVDQFHNASSAALYPPKFCCPSNQIGCVWFEYMITDEAFFYCILAITATYISAYRGYWTETLEATRLFCQSISVVNNTLSISAVPSDATLAVIISLTIHANLTGDLARTRTHLHGLKLIINLRPGGLKSLNGVYQRMLAQKVFRADFELALCEGTELLFHQDVPLPFGNSEGVPIPYALKGLCLELGRVTQDLLAFSRSEGKLIGSEYQDTLVSTGQRLMAYAPLGIPRHMALLDDVWQLGLLAFLNTLFYQMHRLWSVYSGLLLRLLQVRLNDTALAMHPEIRFWLWFFYGFAILEPTDKRWLAPRIRASAHELGIANWEQAKAILQQFPWIWAIHDSPGRKLWNIAMDETNHESGLYLGNAP